MHVERFEDAQGVGQPRPAGRADRLPPHDDEAERGVVGCCLLAPNRCVQQVLDYFRGEQVLYGARNQLVLNTVVALYQAGKPVDLISLQGALRDIGRLDEVGGVQWLAEVQEKTPSAENLPYYLEVVWSKYLARDLVARSVETVGRIYQWNGLTESSTLLVERQWEEWKAKTQRHAGLAPKELQRPGGFGEALHDLVFHTEKELPGWMPPFELGDFRIRKNEMTVLVGDSETGKSTWLNEVCLHLGHQGAKVCLASFEMPCAKSIWVLVRQLLGTNEIPDSTFGRDRLVKALAWLNERFVLYNYLGISDWRALLDAFQFAHVKLGCNVFVVDNLGMMGIPEDDLAQQGTAAAQFAMFAHNNPVHLFAVGHVTKGEGNFKQRARGSKRWSDYTDNALEWIRNEKKREAWQDAQADHEAGNMEEEAWKAKCKELGQLWDARCKLQKQRWGDDAERRNASRYLWFDWRSKQFRVRHFDAPVKWLDRWRQKQEEGEGVTQRREDAKVLADGQDKDQNKETQQEQVTTKERDDAEL